MTLREVLQKSERELPDAWLFLPGNDQQWSLDTEAFLLNPDLDPQTEKMILPEDLAQRDLTETLDTQTVSDCVQWADRLIGRPDALVRFQSFLYYFRFDAFLPKLGAEAPPPYEETRRRLDLEFYDRLGPEDSTRPCRTPGCSRGSVQFSVLCRRHHFENIERRDCPFDH